MPTYDPTAPKRLLRAILESAEPWGIATQDAMTDLEVQLLAGMPLVPGVDFTRNDVLLLETQARKSRRLRKIATAEALTTLAQRLQTMLDATTPAARAAQDEEEAREFLALAVEASPKYRIGLNSYISELETFLDRGVRINASAEQVRQLRRKADEAGEFGRQDGAVTYAHKDLERRLNALANRLERARVTSGTEPRFVGMWVFDPTHRVEYHGTQQVHVWVVAPEIPDGKVDLGQHSGELLDPRYARRLLELATGVPTGEAPLDLDPSWFPGAGDDLRIARDKIRTRHGTDWAERLGMKPRAGAAPKVGASRSRRA